VDVQPVLVDGPPSTRSTGPDEQWQLFFVDATIAVMSCENASNIAAMATEELDIVLQGAVVTLMVCCTAEMASAVPTSLTPVCTLEMFQAH
jgi:hypothetical protein